MEKNINIKVQLVTKQHSSEWFKLLCHDLKQLDISPVIAGQESSLGSTATIDLTPYDNFKTHRVFEIVETVITSIPFEFDSLQLLTEGESKIIRLLNEKIVVEKFKPTIYSFTHNRYGMVEGTDDLRIQFTSEIFRMMNRYSAENDTQLKNAFLGIAEQDGQKFILQKRVADCNLEVRVKRFHIGSPIHRYKYTEKYNTVQGDGSPLRKWSRFDKPVVCFDWRLPLHDEFGTRLADEPISDDYAAVWMNDVSNAKKLACDTFLWLENIFYKRGLLLVDICFFIDKTGQSIFGEISPDCMRVRESLENPGSVKSLDKDIWRQGGKASVLLERYKELYESILNNL
jgi:phosphoribosylaminoimidazole-succinocarboxamide synthase